MLWKRKKPSADHYSYVAVLEVDEVANSSLINGDREFRFTLADGTTANHIFKSGDYQQWWSSFLKGGQVVNP